MLYFPLRLGSLTTDLLSADIRHRAITWTAAASMVAGSVLASTSASAQQVATPYTAQQCDQIRNSINGLFDRYNGKISAELVSDLKEFSRRDCDRSVQIRMMPGTRDNDAVGELKVLIRARMSSLEGPR